MTRSITTSAALSIEQWQFAPRIQAILAIILEIGQEILDELQVLQSMRVIETAEGVHLDYIGRRLGLRRPATRDRAQDPRFGFDDAGQAFDTVPFAGVAENDSVFPLPDATYRRLLKARAITIQSDGSFSAFVQSVHAIDSGASVTDLRDMTLRIVTDKQTDLELADDRGALARNAGIGIIYASRDRFGYDEAGVGFDQGPFAGD